MPRAIEIYDTTLRDGTQAENFNISVEDKIRISVALDELGIDYIEGGWPGSNPVSVEYFDRIKKIPLSHAKISAFGSTRHIRNSAEKDNNLAGTGAKRRHRLSLFSAKAGTSMLSMHCISSLMKT